MLQVGGGLAVLGFFAYGTLMRANIFVDSFTTRMPRRLNQAIDGFWNLVWGVVALVLAERMAVGAMEAFGKLPGVTTRVYTDDSPDDWSDLDLDFND